MHKFFIGVFSRERVSKMLFVFAVIVFICFDIYGVACVKFAYGLKNAYDEHFSNLCTNQLPEGGRALTAAPFRTTSPD